MRVFLCATVAASLLSLGLLRADDRNTQDQSSKEVRGTVTKVDTDNKTLTVKLTDGQEKEFKVNDQTRFLGAAAAGARGEGNQEENSPRDCKTWMSQLHEGSEVTLVLDQDASTPTVKQVRVRDRG